MATTRTHSSKFTRTERGSNVVLLDLDLRTFFSFPHNYT